MWSRWEERKKLERGKRRVATESLREHVCVSVCVCRTEGAVRG